MRTLFAMLLIATAGHAGEATPTAPAPETTETATTESTPPPATAASGEAESPAPEASAVPFALDDQFKQAHDIAFPADRPMLICFADTDGGEHVSPWYDSAKDRYADQVHMLGVGKVDTYPRMMRPLIRLFLRRAAAEVPILLDWDGSVCETYDFQPKVPNILLVDADGRVCCRVNSPMSEDEKERLFAAVDAVLAETR